MRSLAIKLLKPLIISICLLTSMAYTASVPKKIVNKYSQAYIYGFPLVLMHQTELIMLKKSSEQHGHSMLNHFDHLRNFPDASFTDVVSPNADTLYSVAWISLKDSPLLLKVPNMKDNYYLLPMLDAWTNVFASPGTRTTGRKARKFLILGPGQKAKAKKGVKVIKAPTNLVWIIGRIEAKNAADIKTVNNLQDQISLSATSSSAQTQGDSNALAKVNTSMAPIKQVVEMAPEQFFNRLAMLMQNNPPAKADKKMQSTLKKLGIQAGKPFNPRQLGDNYAAVLQAAQSKALQRIQQTIPKMGEQINGWQYNLDIGTYGTNYLKRAAVAYMGLGANLPKDAVYPITYNDYNGQPLDGKYNYILHFSKTQLPPVNAFWSITLYNDKQFFVANHINRYNLGSNTNMKYGKDGSLTIYIQNKQPGKKNINNWLPAPKSKFNLMLRLYWPKTSVLNGKWKPAKIKKVKN